jgi:hypothetical protein
MPMGKAVGTKHMGATKEFVLQCIDRFGPAEVLRGWTGTKAEALEAVRQDPREVFCDCDCAKAENGACLGKEK